MATNTDAALSSARLPLIDADAHVIETEHTWDYLEPEHAKYRPKLFSASDDPNREFWVLDEHICGLRFPTFTDKDLENLGSERKRLLNSDRDAREMNDIKLRLAGLDELGIDIQILHNTMWILSITDNPEVDGALCHAWNRWMADVWAQGEDRLYWTCVIPTLDLDQAIEEIRFARAHGAVAICIRPFEGDLIVTDPYFYPVFEEAVRLDMAIAVHIANGSPELHRLLRGRAFGQSTLSGWGRFTLPAVIAAMSVMMSTVGEDFPTLRWGIIEAAASWIPWLYLELERRTFQTFSADANPFISNNLFVTATIDDDLPNILKYVGEDVLMIGTDFGHVDTSAEYDALSKLRSTSLINDSAREHMLSINPAKLYGLSDRLMIAGAHSGV